MHPVPRRRRLLPALAVALLLAGCAATPPAERPPPATDAGTVTLLDAAIAGGQRLPGNVARDAWRHPKETLAFLGLESTMTVMQAWPGTDSYYTEILAPVLRGHGRLVVATWDPDGGNPYARRSVAAFRARLEARPDVFGKVEVVALQSPGALSPVPPDSVDMVLAFGTVHAWMARDAAVPMLKALYAALRPGGILGVVDNRAPPGLPPDPLARSGYVREDYAIGLVESVGFRLLGHSEVNANPADTKDYDQGVWALPPFLRGGEKDRGRYLAIGESDRFTLRFQKPAAAR